MLELQAKQYRDFPIGGFDLPVPSTTCDDILSKIARKHLDLVGEQGWVAAGQYITDCISSGCLPSLYVYDPDVSDLDASDQFHLRQALALFKKRTDVDIGVDRQKVALKKFLASEEQCALTNSVFLAHSQGRFEFEPRVATVLYRAQQKICNALSKWRPQGAPTVSEIRPRFGPGSSTQHPKSTACAPIKLARTPSIAANTVHLAAEMLSSTGWASACDSTLSVELHASRVKFVPKSAKTDRTMNQEPTANGMWQLGLGDMLHQLLRTLGIDLADQSPNQRAALYGSINQRLATVDLSSASDTIALRLVEYLFPREWYDLFYALSTRMATLPSGQVINLEKVSTMGNGFTFPLETLIFWAIASACQEAVTVPKPVPRVLAYGDDIIIAVQAVPLLKEVFTAVGFTLNTEKSFSAGRFRESCGKDYADGIDVRPFSINCDPVIPERPLDGQQVEGSQFFGLHNFYMRRGLISFAVEVEKLIDPCIRTRGPDGFGDGHLIGTYVPRLVGKDQQKGFCFSTWGFNPRKLKAEAFRQLVGQRKTVVSRFKRSVDLVHPDGACCYGPIRGQLYEQHATTIQEWMAVRGKLAIRVATYAIYIREDVDDSRGYDRLSYLDGVGRTDDDVWVTPGRGPLRRMSVRCFAGPSLAMN